MYSPIVLLNVALGQSLDVDELDLLGVEYTGDGAITHLNLKGNAWQVTHRSDPSQVLLFVVFLGHWRNRMRFTCQCDDGNQDHAHLFTPLQATLANKLD